jgi:hypothetical protein
MPEIRPVAAACIWLASLINSPANGAGPESAPRETVNNDNFVVAAPNLELAGAVLQRAEELRDEIAREWLGQTIPPGAGTAVISVRTTPAENSGRTWPGADLRRPTFMVWLTAPEAEVTGPLLAHEVTHVVLSTRFPGELPPWANEGIASLRDSAERKAIRQRLLAWQASTGNWPRVQQILTAEKIPSSAQGDYSLASSLVEYLLTRGDRSTLLDFAIEGRRRGWDAAIEHYYKIDSVAALQEAWRAWATEQLQDHRTAMATPRPTSIR